jgi:c-di-GMP-related signal transduction protein
MLALLKEIPVDEEIKKALLAKPSSYRRIFEVVLDYESGTWEQLSTSARQIGLHEEYPPDLYLQSVRWVTEVLDAAPVLA